MVPCNWRQPQTTMHTCAQAGTIISLGVSLIICVVWTLIAPARVPWSWKNFQAIEIEDDENVRCHALTRVNVL